MWYIFTKVKIEWEATLLPKCWICMLEERVINVLPCTYFVKKKRYDDLPCSKRLSLYVTLCSEVYSCNTIVFSVDYIVYSLRNNISGYDLLCIFGFGVHVVDLLPTYLYFWPCQEMVAQTAEDKGPPYMVLWSLDLQLFIGLFTCILPSSWY